MPSATVENYLKAILAAEPADGSPVAPGVLASQLGVTPGTVTSMSKQLQRDGFVDYVARQGVVLTGTGRRSALAVLRRHRIVETFLVEVMGLDWAQVHDEAEVLEHVISERLLERMDEMLGQPEADPHGSPIPRGDGTLARADDRPLAEADEGRWRLTRVTEEDPKLLAWLSAHHLAPGSELELHRRDEVAGLLSLGLDQGRKIALAVEPARRIRVARL